jgi:hypothetical protein
MIEYGLLAFFYPTMILLIIHTFLSDESRIMVLPGKVSGFNWCISFRLELFHQKEEIELSIVWSFIFSFICSFNSFLLVNLNSHIGNIKFALSNCNTT